MTSKFDIGGVTGGAGGSVVIGDKAQVVLNGQIGGLEDTIRQMQKALAEMQAEMDKPKPDKGRVQGLLTTLTAGAGSVTALVDGVEKVRQILGLGQ
jgi:hypothetical protein